MKYACLLIIFIGAIPLYAQKNTELDARNGFKDIKLLTDIGHYKGLTLDKHLDESVGIDQYERKKNNYMFIGEIPIKNLSALTYKGKIYQINIVTPKTPDLFKGLEKAFGKARHSVRYQKYFWEGDQVKLTFESISTNRLQLVYYAKGIKAMMKADKKKKIESLSSEF